MVDIINNQVNIDDQNNNQTKTNIFSARNATDLISILTLVGLIGITYKYNPLKFLTNNMLTAIRIKYLSIMVLFLSLVFVMYYYDLLNLSSDYFGPVTITSLVIGCFLFAIVLYYVLAFSKSDVYSYVPPTPTYVINLFQLAIGVSCSIIFTMFLVFMIFNTSSTSPTFSIILNVLIISTLLTLMYKVLVRSPILQSWPWFRLLVNTILYIPCILAGILDVIVAQIYKEKEKTKLPEVILLVISILLIAIYYLLPMGMQWVIATYQGGKILVNESVVLKQPYTIASYVPLNDIDPAVTNPVYEYNYALSLWLYLDALPPSTSAAFDKYTPVFSYGGKPAILYKASNNTMIITAKIKDLTDDMIARSNMDKDENGDVIIYKLENVLLQKWNHILVNYNGGVLDIFYNGKLVKSAKNIVPYMELDAMIIGSPNGINGAICNVVYYNHVLDSNSILALYNSVKDKTPPVLSFAESNADLISKNVQ
jgi:hypothetical protein